MLDVYSLLKLFIRQFGGNKMTNNDLQTKLKIEQHYPHKNTRGELIWFGRVSKKNFVRRNKAALGHWGQAGTYLKIFGFEVQ